jgi:hypothetical protein
LATDSGWSVVSSTSPNGRQQRGGFHKSSTVSKEEQAVATFQVRTRFDKGLDSISVRSYRQDPETVETKAGAMNALGPRGFIREEFAVNGALGKILSQDGHRGPIGFQEEKGAFAVAILVREIERKYPIWNDLQLQSAGCIHVPPKLSAGSIGQRNFIGT